MLSQVLRLRLVDESIVNVFVFVAILASKMMKNKQKQHKLLLSSPSLPPSLTATCSSVLDASYSRPISSVCSCVCRNFRHGKTANDDDDAGSDGGDPDDAVDGHRQLLLLPMLRFCEAKLFASVIIANCLTPFAACFC